MDPDLDNVQWHDAQLARITREGSEVRLEFSRISIYRKLSARRFAEEVGAAVLTFHDARVEVEPPGDERTTRHSRWVMDCTRSEPMECNDIQSLSRGVGPGRFDLLMVDGSTIAATFAKAQLSLVGPFEYAGTYEEDSDADSGAAGPDSPVS